MTFNYDKWVHAICMQMLQNLFVVTCEERFNYKRKDVCQKSCGISYNSVFFWDMLCGLRETNNLIATLVIVTFYELLACVNEL